MYPRAKIPLTKRFTNRVSVMTDSAREELEDFGCLEPVKVAKTVSLALTCCSYDPLSCVERLRERDVIPNKHFRRH
ncbi:hypothetical protein HOLleu_07869 [Holothuria leucospilota]|uniref:Uncharacterized protein n=1 Tax=Holothuria leucospilota TaxID=206669 RepID=A0A9Q1CHR4_HOLLE|nr:hypothetical protein HOLleu_07869 [Holothuria leucospilota]